MQNRECGVRKRNKQSTLRYSSEEKSDERFVGDSLSLFPIQKERQMPPLGTSTQERTLQTPVFSGELTMPNATVATQILTLPLMNLLCDAVRFPSSIPP